MNKIIIYAKTNSKIYELYLHGDMIIINCLLSDYSIIENEMKKLFPEYHYCHYVDSNIPLEHPFYSTNQDVHDPVTSTIHEPLPLDDYESSLSFHEDHHNQERKAIYNRLCRDIVQIENKPITHPKKHFHIYPLIIFVGILVFLASFILSMRASDKLKVIENCHVHQVFDGYIYKEDYYFKHKPVEIPDSLIQKYKMNINNNFYAALDAHTNIINLSKESTPEHYYAITFIQNNHRFFYPPTITKSPFSSSEKFVYTNKKGKLYTMEEYNNLREQCVKNVSLLNNMKKNSLYMVMFLIIIKALRKDKKAA